MHLNEAPILDVRPLLTEERTELLELLRGITDEDWIAPTEAAGWRVKDVALHLLDDDLGWLSRGRDADTSGRLLSDDDRDFVALLDEKNQRWVDGAYALSRRVVVDLLAWSGAQVDAYFAATDLLSPRHVRWASSEPVPAWFDLARNLTEVWVHHQQIREAIGEVGNHADRLLGTVLRTFVWAFPYQYRAPADRGTQLALDLGEGGTWTLTRSDAGWELTEGSSDRAAAAVTMSGQTAWRSLTGLRVDDDAITAVGPSELTEAALLVRGIIV